MQHYPIFLDLAGRAVAVSGGGETALPKLRLLLKTPGRITVFAEAPDAEVEALAAAGRIALSRRAFAAGDAAGMALVYAANGDRAEDRRVRAIARTEGALVNVVDDLHASDFITPAIVDRDPVTVAIGTEGAAPVLARAIKADLEAQLPATLGTLARLGRAFRGAADALPMGRIRRDFWSAFYLREGPRALAEGGEAAVRGVLDRLLDASLRAAPQTGRVVFAGAGPGDPDLLTLKARKALDEADVVIHDGLVPQPILELARREAVLVAAGKTGFGPSTPQGEINRLIVEHAQAGALVVRLKGGDPTLFGRLDEETDACDAAGVSWTVVPGITAASAVAASLGRSLTRRGRNSGVRLVTGHDVEGHAEQDWRSLARPGEVAAIYMGKRAARFVQGRLLMHGADPLTPVSLVENASRPDQTVVGTTLGELPQAVARLGAGPAMILLGIAPHGAAAALPLLETAR